MADEQPRRLPPVALLFLLGAVPLAVLVAFHRTGFSQFDPYRITAWSLVAGALLAVSAVAIPAYLFSRWESEREAVSRDRRR